VVKKKFKFRAVEKKRAVGTGEMIHTIRSRKRDEVVPKRGGCGGEGESRKKKQGSKGKTGKKPGNERKISLLSRVPDFENCGRK